MNDEDIAALKELDAWCREHGYGWFAGYSILYHDYQVEIDLPTTNIVAEANEKLATAIMKCLKQVRKMNE